MKCWLTRLLECVLTFNMRGEFRDPGKGWGKMLV